MREFSTAARRGESAVSNPVPITFKFDDREMTAQPPTTGQLVLFIVEQGKGGTRTFAALFDLLAEVLDDADYKVIDSALREGVDIMVISEIVNHLIGEWSGRPTGSSPGSSGSQRSTGRRSTAKRPSTARTT
jgi:hypothetical protein